MHTFVAPSQPSIRWSPLRVAILTALVLVHAGLVYVTVASLFPENPYNLPDIVNLRQIATIAILVLGPLAFLERKRPALAIGTMLVAVAIALFLPGTVFTAGLILLDAWLVGDAVLHLVQRHDNAAAAPDWGLATLTGLALIAGLACATSAWAIHYAPAFAVLAMLPLLRLVQRAPRLAQRAKAAWQASRRITWSMRIWIALLGVVLVLHLFVAARPEVGYDAQTMHLQFAMMLAAHHAWHHDVERFAWAVMPLGADWMFGIAYLLDGERCARLVNLLFGVLAGRMLFRLARMGALEAPSLIAVTLFASAPLALLVTGSLFSETLWCAFLLGTLVASLEWLRTRSHAALAALYLTMAGAMQAKVISVLWLMPLAAGLVVVSRGAVLRLPTPGLRAVAASAAAIGAWPYAEAWLRTGNPVFPFMNALFRSPYFPTTESFNNASFNAPLVPWTPYELVMQSGRFLEGAPGAPGFQWLLLFPVIALALVLRRRPRLQWGCIALSAVFFVAVYSQQSYLRYLLPALLVGGAVSAWALQDLPDRHVTRVAVAVIGCVLIGLNARFMYAGGWTQTSVCRHCAFDPVARRDHLVRYAPLRIVSDWLNANLPAARVGFLTINDPSPAGYVGYSRTANWHDARFYPAIVKAATAEDVLAAIRSAGLTHVVVHVTATDQEEAITAFRDRYTRPIWESGNYRVALVSPDVVEPASRSALR